jgi:hypothetical protein
VPIGYPTAPYPFVEDAMLLARSLVNDTFPGATATPGEGQILTDSSIISPFTIPFINSAIRRVYRKLGNQGVASLIQDNYILLNLPPVDGVNGVGGPDPAAQVAITFSGYFDGTTLHNTLVLPPNTLAVLKMWERTNGSGNPFTEMTQAQDGLPSGNQGPYLGVWEWRGGSVVVSSVPVFGDGVYMPGCVQATDVRMRTRVSLPSQVSGDGSDFAELQIPVLDCEDAVANYIAAFYTAARGEDDPDVLGRSKLLLDAGDQYTMELANQQIRQKQAVPYQREAYGSSGWGGAGSW